MMPNHPTKSSMEALIQQVISERSCTRFEARRFIHEYIDFKRRESLTQGLRVAQIFTAPSEMHAGMRRSQKITLKNSSRTLLITPDDLLPEPGITMSPARRASLNHSFAFEIMPEPRNPTIYNQRLPDQRCKRCNGLIDELTPNCRTCSNRHTARRTAARRAAQRLFTESLASQPPS